MRFEGSSESIALRLGFSAALRWLAEEVRWSWAHARIADGVRRLRQLLDELDGVHVLTPPECQAGIVAFHVDGVQAPDVVQRLEASRVFVRSTQDGRVRACIGFYHLDEDLLALRDGLALIAQTGK